MTPEDLELDLDHLLKSQPLTLYRLARAQYANLSGVGAAYAPGRWNRLGQEAIYTSTEIGVPLLERLVHTPKDLIPANLAMMKIRMAGGWELAWKDSLMLTYIDGHTKALLAIFKTLGAAKGVMATDGELSGKVYSADIHRGAIEIQKSCVAVAIPSVIVPAWNVVLYPQVPGFWDHVSLESVEPFEFDPRLFPENTPIESA